MELKVIFEHEEMRDMVVHVNSEGLQKIMAILADERNIIVTQLTQRALDDAEVCDCGEPFPESGSCRFCGARSRHRQ